MRSPPVIRTVPLAHAPPVVDVTTCRALSLERWNFRATIYAEWRLYWNDRPGAAVHCDGRSYPLDPDHVVLIAPYAPADLSLTAPVVHLYACYRVVRPQVSVERRAWRFRLRPADRKMFAGLASTLLGGPLGWETGFTLVRAIGLAMSGVAMDDHGAGPVDPRISRAIDTIERGLGVSRVSPRSLAAEANLTANSFARLFRSHTGSSPRSYLLRRRLELAARQLLTSDATIKQVAGACGFCDRYHLTRHFRAVFGVGPASYRRQRPR